MTAVGNSPKPTPNSLAVAGKLPANHSFPSWRRLSGYGLLLVSAAAIVVAVFLLAAHQSRARVLAAATVEVSQRTALLEAHISKTFETNELVLQDVARHIEKMTWEEIGRSAAVARMLAEQKAGLRHAVVIGLLTPDGYLVSDSDRFPFQPVNDSDRDYYRFHRQSAKDVTYLGEPIISRLTGAPSITMSRKLIGPDGMFDGVVVLTMPLSYFSDLLDAAMSASDAALLTRNDGAVIVAAPASAAGFDTEGRLPSGRGYLNLTDDRGVELILAYRRFANYPMSIAVGVDQRQVLGPWRSSFATNAIILGLAMAAVLLSAGLARSRAVSLSKANEVLRETTARLLMAQDGERRKIARDLHDSTGQNLLAAAVEIEIARGKCPSLSGDAVAALERSAVLIAHSAQELRTLSYLLHPPMLDETGLPNALEIFVSGFEKRCGIEVELRVAPELALARPSPHVELAVFRVVQEALSNIHRHSHATAARIRLVNPPAAERGALSLTIDDNGGGFVGKPPGGVGLASMRGRLQALGGTLEIDSGANGTTVTATFPG